MIKVDSRAYSPSSGQGDWIKHPNITLVIEDKKIVEALDTDNELRWSAGRGQWSVADGENHNSEILYG